MPHGGDDAEIMLNEKVNHVRKIVCFKIVISGRSKKYRADVSAESFHLIGVQTRVEVTHEDLVAMGGKLSIPGIKGLPEAVFLVYVLLGICKLRRGIYTEEGDGKRLGGELENGDARRKRDKVVNKWVEELGNSEAHTCMRIRSVTRQTEMPIQGLNMITVQTLGFLQANNTQRDRVKDLRGHFKFTNSAERFNIPGMEDYSTVGRSHSAEAGRRMGEAISLDEFTKKESARSATRERFHGAEEPSLLLNTNLHPFRGGAILH